MSINGSGIAAGGMIAIRRANTEAKLIIND